MKDPETTASADAETPRSGEGIVSASGRSNPGDAPAAHGYIPALDGLRGIAILLVVIYHCSELLHLRDTGNGFDWFSWRFFQLGWMGVDLFFVLSGFLITGILIDSKNKPRYFKTFYARRSLRIFPLYYLVVFFTFAIFPHIASFIGEKSASAAEALAQLPSTEGKLPWYLLYASNFLAAIEGNMGHRLLAVSWSLAIEEQFYFVWPLVVYLCRTRTVMILSAAMVVIAFLCRFGLVAALSKGWWDGNDTAIYVWPFCRMDSLAIGAIIAILWREPGRIGMLRTWSRRILYLGLPFVLFAIFSGRFSNRDGVMQSFGYSFLAFFFAAVLIQSLLLVKGGRMHAILTHPWLLQVGKYAYAIYLFHLPLMFGLQALWFQKLLDMKFLGSSMPSLLAFTAVVTLLVFLAAKVSWVCIERPFLKLKRLFPSDSDRVSAHRET